MQSLYASQIDQIRQELQSRKEGLDSPTKVERVQEYVAEAPKVMSHSASKESARVPRSESVGRIRTSSSELYKNTRSRVDSGLRRPVTTDSALNKSAKSTVLSEEGAKKPSRRASKGDIKSNSKFVKPLRDDLRGGSSRRASSLSDRLAWRSQDLLV